MKTHGNVLLAVAAFVLAGILAGTANAQQAIAKDARFTLPFSATWEETVLPPGDYTFSVSQLSGGRGVEYRVAFAGEGRRKTIVVVSRPGDRVAERAMLVVVCRGQACSIRALHLPSADLVLTFPESREKRELVAKAPETRQSVPIQVAAK